SRVMQPSTLALLARAGVRPGMTCLEVGCGSGDLAFDLARMVSPSGRVVATDIDRVKLDLARADAQAQGLHNIEFQFGDITQDEQKSEFDLVHARFVLTHLPKPDTALAKMRQALRPGGIAVVEDIDFRGYFCHPECAACERFVELYMRAVQRRGGDPNIGPRLPGLLKAAGFDSVQMNLVQPAAMSGEIKLLTPITMESIADAVIAEGLASSDEISLIVEELYAFANSPETIMSAPRVIEAWGWRQA